MYKQLLKYSLIFFTLIIGISGCKTAQKTLPKTVQYSSGNAGEDLSTSTQKLMRKETVQENTGKKTATLASLPGDFTLLHLDPDKIEAWEDALRTNGKEGSYEWWYSDFLLNDGTVVVVVFYTKFGFDILGPSRPTASINIIFPDGRQINRSVTSEDNASFSQEKADLHIGRSFLKNNSGNLLLHYEDDTVIFDTTMQTVVPSWRPQTGYVYFGESQEREDYMAWLVFQPLSHTQATLQVQNESKNYTAIGYHDHNWGNIPLNVCLNHWYWGRAQAGDYTIIFSNLVASEQYAHTSIPMIMLARKETIIPLSSSYIQKSNITADTTTGKSFANKITLFAQDAHTGDDFEITFTKGQQLTYADLNEAPYELGDNPTYIRVSAAVEVKVVHKNGAGEIVSGHGLVEQMALKQEVIEPHSDSNAS